jgi:hypothetical protein
VTLDEADLIDVFKHIDADGSGLADKEEFMASIAMGGKANFMPPSLFCMGDH